MSTDYSDKPSLNRTGPLEFSVYPIGKGVKIPILGTRYDPGMSNSSRLVQGMEIDTI